MLSLDKISELLGKIWSSLEALLRDIAIAYGTTVVNQAKSNTKAAQAVIDNVALKNASEKEIYELSDEELDKRTVAD